MSEARLGRKFPNQQSASSKAKTSAANKISIKIKWQDPIYRMMQSEAHKRAWGNPEYAKRMSQAHIGKPGFWKDKQRPEMVALWSNPEYHERTMGKILKALQSRPTIPEVRFQEICVKHSLPYKYVGNGQYFIGGLNPDFIHNDGQKKLVEILGLFWHDPKLNSWIRQTARLEVRAAIFHDRGWTPIFFWENELQNEQAVVERLSK